MAIKYLLDSDFDGFVKDGLVIVDFWASWCGPCRSFSPVFEAVSEKFGAVSFGKYEITDTNRMIADRHGIRSIPAVVAFKNGKQVDMKTGLMDDIAFEDWVRRRLS
jgi:thioredoxin